jgi:hypothetical protein
MSDTITFRLTQYRSLRSILVMAVIFCCVIPAAAQYPAVSNLTGQSTFELDRQLTGPWDAFVEYAGTFPNAAGRSTCCTSERRSRSQSGTRLISTWAWACRRPHQIIL